MLRHLGQVAHDAVDACADEEVVALRLEVHVGRAFVDRVGHERVDEVDRRRAGGHVADVVDARGLVLFVCGDDAELDPRAVGARERVRELRLLGDGDPERHAQRELEVVGRAKVRRVGHRHEERTVGKRLERERVVPARELLGQELDGVRVDLDVVEVDERELALVGDGACDLERRHHPQLDEHGPEPAAAVLLRLQRLLELLRGDQPAPGQDRAERKPADLGGVRVHGRVVVEEKGRMLLAATPPPPSLSTALGSRASPLWASPWLSLESAGMSVHEKGGPPHRPPSFASEGAPAASALRPLCLPQHGLARDVDSSPFR